MAHSEARRPRVSGATVAGAYVGDLFESEPATERDKAQTAVLSMMMLGETGGGIIAILKGAPDLTSDNLEFI